MKELIFRYCDVEGILERIRQPNDSLVGAGPCARLSAKPRACPQEGGHGGPPLRNGDHSIRIAYAWDEAFHFYYQDNLDFLEELGAELVPFSPIHDPRLPDDTHALYFGGGFPEVYAKALQANTSMKESILIYSKQEIPIYAECGGLMYLSEGITDLEGNFYRMAGIIPGKIKMTDRLQNFGYQQGNLLKDSWVGKGDHIFRAHEFHYSTWSGEGISPAHQAQGKNGAPERMEGYLNSHILASYLHLHFLSVPERARCLIETAKKYKMYSAYGTRSQF